jgi:hypothetical protein
MDPLFFRPGPVENIQTMVEDVTAADLVLLFSLKHDFPNEWHRFIAGTGYFEATIKGDYFPYFIRGKDVKIEGVELYAIKPDKETFEIEFKAPQAVPYNLNDPTHAACELSFASESGPGAVLERNTAHRHSCRSGTHWNSYLPTWRASPTVVWDRHRGTGVLTVVVRSTATTRERQD